MFLTAFVIITLIKIRVRVRVSSVVVDLLWDRYHIPQNVFLVIINVITCCSQNFTTQILQRKIFQNN